MAAGRTFGVVKLSPDGKEHLFEVDSGTGDVRTLCGQVASRPTRPRTYPASPANLLLDSMRRLGTSRCARCSAKVQQMVGSDVRSFDRALRYGSTPMDPADRPTAARVVASPSASRPMRIRLSGSPRFHVFAERVTALCGSTMAARSHHQGPLRFDSMAAVLAWLDANPEKPRCDRCLAALEARVHPRG